MSHAPLRAARAEEVWELLAREVRPLPPVGARTSSAIDRVLAADAVAQFDYPPFDRSVVDGYAVRTADFRGGGAMLCVLGLVQAGRHAPTALKAGACWQINTGGPLPEGADAVVMVEDSRQLENGHVELRDAEITANKNIERRASLLRRGERLLPAGTRITPGAAAALVSAGIYDVTVAKRPVVTLLSTGDELVDATEGGPLEHGQIVDSNGVVLSRIIMRLGCRLISLDRCGDEKTSLRAALESGLHADLLCVVGGMSKGTHDLVPGTLEELGVEWLVTSLDLKPGKPTRIGRAPGGAWVVGLPGNPVSCTVCFLLFARGIIDGLSGLTPGRPAHVRGRLLTDMPGNGKRALYQPAAWAVDADGVPQVRPVAWRGSGDPFGLALANALIQRPPQCPPARSGDAVAFIPLDLPQ